MSAYGGLQDEGEKGGHTEPHNGGAYCTGCHERPLIQYLCQHFQSESVRSRVAIKFCANLGCVVKKKPSGYILHMSSLMISQLVVYIFLRSFIFAFSLHNRRAIQARGSACNEGRAAGDSRSRLTSLLWFAVFRVHVIEGKPHNKHQGAAISTKYFARGPVETASKMASLQETAKSFQQRFESMIKEITVLSLPMQKKSFQCCVSCFDNHKNEPESIAECINRCHEPSQSFNHALQREVEALQTSIESCQKVSLWYDVCCSTPRSSVKLAFEDCFVLHSRSVYS